MACVGSFIAGRCVHSAAFVDSPAKDIQATIFGGGRTGVWVHFAFVFDSPFEYVQVTTSSGCCTSLFVPGAFHGAVGAEPLQEFKVAFSSGDCRYIGKVSFEFDIRNSMN